MATGLGIVRPPAHRQPEEEKSESGETEVLSQEEARILPPLSEYIPLVGDARAKTADPICWELAIECDRLRVLIDDCYSKKSRPGETSAIIGRRISALRLLATRLDEVAGRERVQIELATISSIVSMVRDVLRETGVAHETREIVFQKLLSRISAARDEASSVGA